MSHWILAIDFGTSNTAAAVRSAGRPDQSVRLGASSTVMPSGVVADSDGTLLVGETARHAMGALPKGSYLRRPKRQLGYGDVMLGFHRFSDVDLVAAVLKAAAAKATRMFDGTPCDELRLTYPAAWGETRRELLSRAAVQAGLPEPVLVTEPVAAATYYAANHANESGGPVGVFDMGGGTLDVAVLQPTAGTYEVLSVAGEDPLGGETFDEQLELFARDQLAARGRGDLWERLEGHDAVAAKQTTRDNVRNAKHVLSEVPVADVPIAVGDDSEVVRVTRAEFEDRIRPWLAKSVIALQNAIAATGLTPGDLDRLYMVGGSTYIPAVPETITQSIGITPATYDDPKTVTSLGALAVPQPSTATKEGRVDHIAPDTTRIEPSAAAATQDTAPEPVVIPQPPAATPVDREDTETLDPPISTSTPPSAQIVSRRLYMMPAALAALSGVIGLMATSGLFPGGWDDALIWPLIARPLWEDSLPAGLSLAFQVAGLAPLALLAAAVLALIASWRQRLAWLRPVAFLSAGSAVLALLFAVLSPGLPPGLFTHPVSHGRFLLPLLLGGGAAAWLAWRGPAAGRSSTSAPGAGGDPTP